MSTQFQSSIFLPERFDILERRTKKDNLKNIVVAVQDSLNYINDIYSDMESAGRGAFLVFRGESGSGKSTFLHTLYLFKEGVVTESIDQNESVSDRLKKLSSTQENLRVLVIEGREALTDFSEELLEKDLHTINSFMRSYQGEKTLIVWPCNSDELEHRLITLAKRIGGESLLGISQKGYQFSGPPKSNYLSIANRTIETLNEGASLTDLGLSEKQATELIPQANTIGAYISLLRQELRNNQNTVTSLLDKEQCHVWTVVIAGNDPKKDIEALTRGSSFTADTSHLMSSTEANIVEKIKKDPEKVGLLGTVLDAKILHLPVLTALAITKQYANPELRSAMRNNNMSINLDHKMLERLNNSQLVHALKSAGRQIGRPGKSIGTNSVNSFEKLASIARQQDGLLNRTIGEALQKSGLIDSYQTENEFIGNGLTFKSDITCQTNQGSIRLEIMWRKKTSQAEIANYVLTKLYNYGCAIGFLQPDKS
ncbi:MULTISPECIES: hypothetical protein [Planktothrix]|jgi:DNA (cytosine-5)-methyltransferase 1|uniref:ATP-binding protein n=2 Tax=Planktothrix TaxID=54304 RepID=A0A4P6A2Q0_PLAAG|nr:MULTISPECIES: hypothetical protein [Planktothrix]GDZ95357.1 hypothetical protein PA905_36540 [Planktothrix agardhii CCAP 1459/11A]CAC5345561.1 conserved hypothetical protein [Planktothrix rubescens NIVA-CYA 18]CAD5957085.1 hypothetical protein PCC7821_02914 [Planktothrix rubescens NIVA-CYA 18]